ncbi:MAG: hypothetical protein DI570_09320 [Phenylobacterium zucineum]|nr:MAG: hypothetical protein DI570_09320 [Phenylobacterium zucineum]
MSGAHHVFNPGTAVTAMRKLHDLPIMVAAAVDDGEGGVFISFAHEDFSIEDAEFLAATLLRDLAQVMSEDSQHHCDDCARRFARIRDAVTVLERDGAKPTGKDRGALQ